ncbi:MAG: ankyrin repeat domain-containing protein [Raoultibacter sp.]
MTENTPITHNEARNNDSGGQVSAESLIEIANQIEDAEKAISLYENALAPGNADVLSELAVLLLSDTNIDADFIKEWPLDTASRYGYTSVVETLLKHGADPNALNQVGSPPLLWAGKFGYYEIAQMLLAAGADPNIMNPQIATPLSRAIENDNFELVKLLISNGADVNTVVVDQGSPIFGLPCSPLAIAVRKNNQNIVRILLEAGAQSGITDNRQYDLLTKCREFSGAFVDERFLYKNIDLVKYADSFECSNEYEETKRLLAASTRSTSYMSNPNTQDQFGQTQLMQACVLGDIEKVTSLIDLGANVNLTDEDGRNALYYALRGAAERYTAFHDEIVEALLNAGGNIMEECFGDGLNDSPSLFLAIRSNSTRIADSIIKRCRNVNVTSTNGSNALMWCDNHDDISIAKKLIDGGISVNQLTNEGHSALWFATEKNNISLVKLLLEKGADPNIADPVDITDGGFGHLVFRAAYLQHREIMELLTRYGAKLNIAIEIGKYESKFPLPKGVALTLSGYEQILRKGYDGIVHIITEEGAVNHILSHGCRSGIVQKDIKDAFLDPINDCWSFGIIVR